jgi:hypothetical protein
LSYPSIFETLWVQAELKPTNSAVDNEGTLDKEATSYDDVFDAYRLALEFYHHKLD